MNDGSNFHVLLVEDDRKLAEGVREYLDNHGMTVVLEGRGDRGLEVAARGASISSCST